MLGIWPMSQIVSTGGWVLESGVELEARTVGEWSDIINQLSPWRSEAECRAFLDRVRPKFENAAIFEGFEGKQGWEIEMVDSEYAHWHEPRSIRGRGFSL